MKSLLVALCSFAVIAAVWLAVMEQILHHPGYVGRSVIAGLIGVQAVATLVLVVWHGAFPLRALVSAGAIAILVLGCTALYRVATAQHFEGFVVIISGALILQGVLTLLTWLPGRFAHAH